MQKVCESLIISERSEAMLIPEYYHLSEAAKELDCTEDYLKHLAANRKLRIHVLTGGQSSWVTLCFNEQHDRWVEFR